MMIEYKHNLRRMRGQIIGWGVGIALYGLMMVSLYDTINRIEGLQQLIDSYPPEFMAFFGGMTDLSSPQGYLDTYFFSYMTLIIGIFVVGAGGGLLAADEERGILDLVLAHPLSRAGLFAGRFLSMVTAIVLVLLLGWLSWAVPGGSTTLGLSWLQYLRPFLPLLAQLLVFGCLALFLSMVLPASRIAGMLSGALLFANFLLLGLAKLNDKLEPVVKLTPMYYYEGGKAIKQMNWGWSAGLLLAALALTVGAWVLFKGRDIRVAGERSWRIPGLRGRSERSARADRQAG
jgi:ABC-2 type transport system permease protein